MPDDECESLKSHICNWSQLCIWSLTRYFTSYITTTAIHWKNSTRPSYSTLVSKFTYLFDKLLEDLPGLCKSYSFIRFIIFFQTVCCFHVEKFWRSLYSWAILGCKSSANNQSLDCFIILDNENAETSIVCSCLNGRPLVYMTSIIIQSSLCIFQNLLFVIS